MCNLLGLSMNVEETLWHLFKPFVLHISAQNGRKNVLAGSASSDCSQAAADVIYIFIRTKIFYVGEVCSS